MVVNPCVLSVLASPLLVLDIPVLAIVCCSSGLVNLQQVVVAPPGSFWATREPWVFHPQQEFPVPILSNIKMVEFDVTYMATISLYLHVVSSRLQPLRVPVAQAGLITRQYVGRLWGPTTRTLAPANLSVYLLSIYYY